MWSIPLNAEAWLEGQRRDIMKNPASKPSRNIFDLIVQMLRERDFALAMCQHVAHLDHPVVRQFQTKLEQTIHRHTREASCGTGAAGEQRWSPEVARSPGSQRRGRFEDPRLAELHEDEGALRQEQRKEWIRQAEERGWLETYEALRGDGLSHRQALNQIADSTGTRGKGGGSIDTLFIASGISAARARRNAGQRQERDEKILKLAEAGVSPKEIAEKLGVAIHTVKNVLRKCRAKKGERST